jgi:hypothetical protein
MQNLQLGQSAGCQTVRPRGVVSDLTPRGRFQVEHYRGGKLIGVYDIPNGITDEGKKRLFDVMFNQGTQITDWFVGLIDNTGYSALAAANVYTQINGKGGDGNTNGWREFEDYTDENNTSSAITRPAWPEEAASGAGTVVMTNTATKAVFKVTAAGTIKGLFLAGGVASCQNKGDFSAGGLLWATALFTQGDTVVAIDDVLNVTYSVSA